MIRAAILTAAILAWMVIGLALVTWRPEPPPDSRPIPTALEQLARLDDLGARMMRLKTQERMWWAYRGFVDRRKAWKAQKARQR